MKLNDIYTEEKVRLDPSCWDNKKIGNPKTKMKGGVRVNNCVPAESVAEDIDRRGFLKGMGAAAVAGAAGGVATKANAQQVVQWTKYATDLATKTMGRIHQDTGYDLRNWLVVNVGNWVSDYCTQTNSYNAKEVIDYCNQQGVEASGLDKQNALVTAFLTNMKSRYQDFLTAYRAGIQESYQKFNAVARSQQSSQQTQQPKQSSDEVDQSGNPRILKGMIELYVLAKDNNFQNVDAIKQELLQYIKITNNKDLVNDMYKGIKSGLDNVKASNPTRYNNIVSMYQESSSRRIGEFKNWTNSLSAGPEFKESVEQGVAEAYNAEYDDEAGMADNNLETLRRTVDGLDDIIDAGDNLPEWCQEKIAVAKSMLVAVWDYMESEDDTEEDPEIAEMYEAMESLAEEMARRNRVSVDRVWESFEALDDHMLYETAAWRRKEGKSKSGGLNAKGVASYRRENPGSKLQTAVTTKPSKLKKGSKAAKRRKSFCARMSGVKGPMKKPNGKPTRKALALRKWNC